MSEVMQPALSFLAGMLLGAMFFGGLWWTVQKGLASPRPAQWFLGSLLLRSGITLAGFYVVAGGDWKKMATCLLGFITARIIITRLAALPMGIPLSPNSDGSTSHSTKPASGQVAGYLPQAGGRDAVSPRDSHIKETSHAP